MAKSDKPNIGFDEFFGNLYHLNAEEEPEMDNYPSEKEFPQFHKMFKPRGVMHSWATDKDDPTEEPRWGRVGKQTIEDTGPLTKNRMDFLYAAQVAAGRFAETFREFPPRQKAASFTLDDALAKMSEAVSGAGLRTARACVP